MVYTGEDLSLVREKFAENKIVKEFAQHYNKSN